MLKKNGFIVYSVNEYKTSSYCPTCENELEKFKTVPNPRPYQRKKKLDVLCNCFAEVIQRRRRKN
jgi:hypothetical protein